MKNQFEFFGIKSPQRKELTRKFLKDYSLPTKENAESIIKEIWTIPQRECQYVALEISERLAKRSAFNDIQLFEYLIVTKSWWDTVDWLATRIVGEYMKKFPEAILPAHEKWLGSGNMWLQRVCILFQLKYKQKTDVELLFKTIRQLAQSKKFFIQKAIGWALREYSKTNAAVVRNFIENEALAPLSVREGMRLIKY